MNDAHNAKVSVRYFVPCDKVERWGNGAVSLTRIRTQIPNPNNLPMPRCYNEMYFYLALTNGTGNHVFQIQQVCLLDQTRIFRWPSVTINMGDDFTVVQELVIRLPDVPFWAVGQCEFLLYCGSDRLAEAVIEVR